MKILRMVGVFVGFALLGLLVHQVGWAPVRQTVSMLGWKFAWALLVPLFWITFNTLGWRLAFLSRPAGLSLARLAEIRVAGETFNALLPSGYVGGEPFKVKFLSRWISRREAMTSVLVAKAAQSLALLLYAGFGLTIAVPGSRAMLHHSLMGTAALGVAVGILLFPFVLAHGGLSRIGTGLQRLTPLPWLRAQEERLIALDASLGDFYRKGRSSFLGSVGCHLLGWVGGALDLAFMFFLVGHPIAWRQAWFIAALAQTASILGVVSPAGLGFFEGAHYIGAALVGLPPALGLSVGLIRRVRDLVWNGIGVGIFWRLFREPGKQD